MKQIGPIKSRYILISLCNLCVLCVSVVCFCLEFVNHRDTENTEIAQRRGAFVTFCGRIDLMFGAYEAAYNAWLQDPEGFWAQAAESIHWYRRWDKVLDTSRPPFYRWFSGGLLNTCYNLLDAHVENGRADQIALIYDSPVTGTVKSYTYRELLDEVARFAG